MLSKQLFEFVLAANPEAVLLKHLDEATGQQVKDDATHWRPGQSLNLLLSGYFGAGNVGSDMRSSEILRQIRHLLGENNVKFSALAVTDSLAADVYADVECRMIQGYIPEFLATEVTNHHGVIACEGSMFKSTFSDALSGLMSATLGMAARQGKIAVGYGAEIGGMTDGLRAFVRRNTGDALILCRNGASRTAAKALGLRAIDGADTAWTFRASSADTAYRLLKSRGWNGADPILTICPINPFWWPVRANPAMALEMQRSGAHRDRAYGSLFFHSDSEEIRSKYAHYIDELARGVRRILRERNAFPVVLGMERVDARACRDLSDRLEITRPPLLGCEHNVADVIAVLRTSSLLISSRFHAIVGAMPAAVPSIGISMDERINNLFCDSGQSDRVLPADTADLANELLLRTAQLDPAQVAETSQQTVKKGVMAIGQMGLEFTAEIQRILPTFPLPSRPPTWQAHLPRLPQEIERLVS